MLDSTNISKLYEINTAAMNENLDRFTCAADQIRRSWNSIVENSYEDADGLRRWESNDRLIPVFVLESDACLHVPPAHRAAYEAEMNASLAEYRRSQPAEPSGEERFEALAAFGPGQEVVDVFTGRRFTT